MDSDFSKPCGELCLRSKLVEMLIRPEVGFLHYVLGLGIVSKNCQYDPVDPLIVPAHQDFIQRHFSPQNQPHQFFIGEMIPFRNVQTRYFGVFWQRTRPSLTTFF